MSGGRALTDLLWLAGASAVQARRASLHRPQPPEWGPEGEARDEAGTRPGTLLARLRGQHHLSLVPRTTRRAWLLPGATSLSAW